MRIRLTLFGLLLPALVFFCAVEFLHGQSSDEILWVKGGSGGTVIAATQSPDGRYVASAEPGGRTVVWERNTGNQVRILPHRTEEYWAEVAFLQDSRMLAVASGAVVFFYDALSGEVRGEVPLPDTAVIRLFPLRDTTLLVVHASGLVHQLDPIAGSLLHSSQVPDTSVFAPQLIDNGSLLLYVDAGDTLKVWDRNGGQLLSFRSFLSYDRRFGGAAGTSVVAVAGGDSVLLRNVRTGDTLSHERIDLWIGYVTNLSLSSTGDTMVVGFGGGEHYLADSRSGRIFFRLPAGGRLYRSDLHPYHFRSVHDAVLLDFSPAGDALLLRAFSSYDFASGGFRFLLYRLDTGDSVDYIAHTVPVDRVAVEPEGKVAVTGTGNVWDFPSGTFRSESDLTVGYSRDGRTFARGAINPEAAFSGYINIVTVGGRSWTAWDHYDEFPWVQAISPGGRYAVIGQELYFADSTYHQRKKLPDGFSFRFAWDGDHFAAWGPEHVFIWDCRTVSVANQIDVDGFPTVVEFSKDNSRIAVGHIDGRIDIYETFSGNHLIRLDGHRGRVNDISFTRRDRFLVSAGADSTVRTWALEGGTNDYTYTCPAAQLSVSTSSDGRHILTGGEDLTATCRIGKGGIGRAEESLSKLNKDLIASMYPNPLVGGRGRVECIIPHSGRLTLEIVSPDGCLVFRQTEWVRAGHQTFELPLLSLPSGSYYSLLRLESGGSVIRTGSFPLNILR